MDLGLLAVVLKLQLSPLLRYDQRCRIASLICDDGERCAAEHSPLFLFAHLTEQPRLASNLRSSCLSLQLSGVTGLCQQSGFVKIFSILPLLAYKERVWTMFTVCRL